MQSPSSPINGSYLTPGRRRGHVPQISISDDNHHVTEAIGDMYGDNDFTRNGVNLETAGGGLDDSLVARGSGLGSTLDPVQTGTPHQSRSLDSDMLKRSALTSGSPRTHASSLSDIGSGSSPTPMLTRTGSTDTATQQFPLADIDYESSPAAVAQELSNLQAIRRMSMNVDAADPDLPSFSSGLVIPSLAPRNSASEDDASRLFWVPAHLHPELAPKEFKTFVEDRVDRIRRMSGENSQSPADDSEYRRSAGSLGRRHSMLSRTIDSPAGYQDGAERLERKRSESGRTSPPLASEKSLQELESLVSDTSVAVRKISVETARRSSDSASREQVEDDAPMLPQGGQSLKRSTRTNYRKGSLRKGERVPFSRRAVGRHLEEENNAINTSSSFPSGSERLDFKFSRVQTEPLPALSERHDFDLRGQPTDADARFEEPSTARSSQTDFTAGAEVSNDTRSVPFKSRIASGGRTTAYVNDLEHTSDHSQMVESTSLPANRQHSVLMVHPARTSSHEFSRTNNLPVSQMSPKQLVGSTQAARRVNDQTLDDMANNPSLMPGTSTRTDSLSFIPTFSEDKETTRRSKDRSSDSSIRKTSWGWLLGGDDRDREKKERDKEEKESSKKSKLKQPKSTEKGYDSTRLDVLHTASGSPSGRESLVLDRDSIVLGDEKKKDSGRRLIGSEGKREGGLLSSLFGGGRKKGDKDATSRRRAAHNVPPEPTFQLLRADIDYNWTRFSILEERAIYRMAHIKLANPRRALHSQVLLSNFMYSYLAKVQQMHPSIQIPQFVLQKSQKRQDRPKSESQSEEYSQWQRYQEQHGPDRGFDSVGSDIDDNHTMTDRSTGLSLSSMPGSLSTEQVDSRHADASSAKSAPHQTYHDSSFQQARLEANSHAASDQDMW